jgi:hypothetical protein
MSPQLKDYLEKVSREHNNLRGELADMRPEAAVEFLFKLLNAYREAVLCSGYPDSRSSNEPVRDLALYMAGCDMQRAKVLWDEGVVDDLLPADVLSAKNRKPKQLGDTLRPGDFLSHPTGSVVGRHEAEVVARNIMVIRTRLGNKWDLTLEEYREHREKDGHYKLIEEEHFKQIYPLISTPMGAIAFAPGWAKVANEIMTEVQK